MNDDAGLRHANLRRLCHDKAWTAKDLHKKLGKTYPYWRDLLTNDTKSFGEKSARSIEEKLELPRGWLDDSHPVPPKHQLNDKTAKYVVQSRRASQPVVAPPRVAGSAPPPPVDFRARVVSDSEWAILEDVKLIIPPQELAEIHRKAEVIREQAKGAWTAEQLTRQAAPEPPPPSKKR